MGSLLVLVALAAVAAGCSSDRPAPAEPEPLPSGPVALEPQEAVRGAGYESSGTRLSGIFVLASDGEAPPDAASRYVFTDEGAFARTRTSSGGVALEESGSYLVDREGRLVLFVERRADLLLGFAEAEVYGLTRTDGGLSLERRSTRLDYVREADAPGRGAGRPEVE